MFRTGYTCTRTHTHTSPRTQVCRKSTHSHSIMLLSHSPRSHFSQSPGVCEGQSGLSSHKPRLHTRLPAKVCVSTKCNAASRDRDRDGKMERTQVILQHNVVQDPITLPVRAAAWLYWRLQCIWEIRIGDLLFKRHVITRAISRLRSLRHILQNDHNITEVFLCWVCLSQGQLLSLKGHLFTD